MAGEGGSEARAKTDSLLNKQANGDGAMCIELTPQSIIGLLCAFARVDRLPARGWALEAGLEIVDRHDGDEQLALKRAVSRLPRGPGGVLPRFGALDKLLQDLAQAGHLTRAGRGWDAGFVPDKVWIAAHEALAVSLSARERALLRKAAQALKATLTTWSKNAVASGPAGAGTM